MPPLSKAKPRMVKSASKSQGKSKSRNPKDSHLYTDDNPSTTLHGTGFKDALTARHTLTLISQRSLTYQWQVVNTMYHRAKGHPSMRRYQDSKSSSNGGDDSRVSNMLDAMAIYRTWLDETYPSLKEARRLEGREFKPLLSKPIVERYLDRIRALKPPVQGIVEGSGAEDIDTNIDDDEEQTNDFELSQKFAELYANLPKGKRLANTLVDDAHPEKEDWEVMREKALWRLTKQHREGIATAGQRQESGEESTREQAKVQTPENREKDLWNDKGGMSEWHLRCIAWAWSPVGEKRLPP